MRMALCETRFRYAVSFDAYAQQNKHKRHHQMEFHHESKITLFVRVNMQKLNKKKNRQHSFTATI